MVFFQKLPPLVRLVASLVPRVTDRKVSSERPPLVVDHGCRSELRGVDDHSLSVCTGVNDDYVRLFPPALLMNKRCAVLTSVAVEHVPF